MKTLPLLTALVLSLGSSIAVAQTEPTRSRAEVKSEARAAAKVSSVPSRGESSASELPPQAKSDRTRGEVKEARKTEAQAAAARREVASRGESSASDLPPQAKSKKPRSEVKSETRTALKAGANRVNDPAPGR